jgi:hypothetical protein
VIGRLAVVDPTLNAGVQGADLAIAIEELAELYEELKQGDEATRRWIQAIALHEKAAIAARIPPAGHLRKIGDLHGVHKQMRAAKLFRQRAEQLVLLQRSR